MFYSVRRGPNVRQISKRLGIVIALAAGLTLATAQPVYSGERVSDFAGTDADTVAAYIETLELDLAISRSRAAFSADSLGVNIRLLQYEVDYLSGNQRQWYNDSRIWFLFGAVAATLVIGATLQITF